MHEYCVACGIGRLRNSCFFVFGTDVDKIRSLAISVKYHGYNNKITRLNGLQLFIFVFVLQRDIKKYSKDFCKVLANEMHLLI